MKMQIEKNKVSMKKVIKELHEDYGKRGMRYEVSIWCYSGREIEYIDNDGKDYRYEIILDIWKNSEMVDSITHKAIPSDLDRTELDEKTLALLHKEQDALIEWIRKTYLYEPVDGIERDIWTV